MRLASFLILSLFIFSACEEEIPISHFGVINVPHHACPRYDILDKKSMTVDEKGIDRPLEDCDGGVVISYQEFLEFKEWAKKKQRNRTGE